MYQKFGIKSNPFFLYFENFRSLLMSGICSVIACAIIIRSKGSVCLSTMSILQSCFKCPLSIYFYLFTALRLTIIAIPLGFSCIHLPAFERFSGHSFLVRFIAMDLGVFTVVTIVVIFVNYFITAKVRLFYKGISIISL